VKRLGLIVNPIAGMGGRLGLKGTDGESIQRICREAGAQAEAPGRAREALRQLEPIRDSLQVLTYPRDMGEHEARSAGLATQVIGTLEGERTTSMDTRRAACDLADAGVDLLLFAGGDGTARDLQVAVAEATVVLGIPAGVKIHSAVFATTPRAAGQLALLYLKGGIRRLKEAEVMDIDEKAFRDGRVSAELFGYLRIPYEEHLVQGMKAGRSRSEEADLELLSHYVLDHMQPGVLFILGSGTTMRRIKDRLGPGGTLLGVDVALDHKLIATDVNEQGLLELLDGRPARIVVTVIGGQGYLFGRGNQQISPRVIRRVGRDNIQVVATRDKVIPLTGRPLLVDTGDPEVDAQLSGYIRVTTGYFEQFMFPVSS
jgi:predicted polyphosphate/ATP-dependent NAD kinase